MRVMINRKRLLEGLKLAARVVRADAWRRECTKSHPATVYAKVEVAHGHAELLSSNGHTMDVIDKLGEVRCDADAGSLFILIEHTLQTIKGIKDEFVFFEGTESSTTLRFGTFKSTYLLKIAEAEERVIAEYTFGAEDYATIAEMEASGTMPLLLGYVPGTTAAPPAVGSEAARKRVAAEAAEAAASKAAAEAAAAEAASKAAERRARIADAREAVEKLPEPVDAPELDNAPETSATNS